MQNVPLERLSYSIQEASAISGLSRATIYRLIGSNRLTVRKIGRRTVVPAAAMRSLIEGEAA